MLKPLPKRFAYAAFGHWEPNGGRMSNSASMRWTFTAPESRDRVRDRERRRLGRTTGCEWMRGAAIHETTRQERTQACRIDDMSYGEVGDSLLPVVSDVSTLTSAVFSSSYSSKFSKFFITSKSHRNIKYSKWFMHGVLNIKVNKKINYIVLMYVARRVFWV